MTTTLSTRRLALEPFRDDDVDELHAVFADADVRRYLLDDEVVSRAWVADEIGRSEERFRRSGAGLWAVRIAGRAPIIGFVGFRPFFEPPVLQLLYGFLPSHWGRGLATEAAAAAIRYAFERLGFESVEAATDLPNAPSARVLERLGMHEWQRTPDGEHGTVFFRIERADWEARDA